MVGVRTDADKERSKKIADSPLGYGERKVGVYMYADILRGEPMRLSLEICDADKHRYGEIGKARITVSGDVPLEAISRPTDRALAEKNLIKLGGTVFFAEKIEINIDEGLMVPVSALNALRRAAIEALEERLLSPYKDRGCLVAAERSEKRAGGSRAAAKVAIFTELSQIPKAAYEYFDEIYLPAAEFARHSASELRGVSGVELPAVIFDSERAELEGILELARGTGARFALVGNVGHKALAEKFGFEIRGGFRLNVSNGGAARSLSSLGFESVTLSPELTIPKIRDIAAADEIDCRAIIYGRIPLMIVEKCVICEALGTGKGGALCPFMKEDRLCRGTLTDRTGTVFPVAREFAHRNIIFNSLPVYMADKQGELSRAALGGHVFIFADEDASEVEAVISAYEKGTPASARVRRIGVQQ